MRRRWRRRWWWRRWRRWRRWRLDEGVTGGIYPGVAYGLFLMRAGLEYFNDGCGGVNGL